MSRVSRLFHSKTGPRLSIEIGTLLEIAHAFDVLHADGISLSSSYGTGSEGGECMRIDVVATAHRRDYSVYR